MNEAPDKSAWGGNADGLTEMLEELNQLRGFARDIFNLSDWPEGGEIDGFDIQRLGEKYGLLKQEIRHEPCGETCQCSEYYGSSDMKEGVTCYRKSGCLTLCEHGRGPTDYCEPCGRIEGGG